MSVFESPLNIAHRHRRKAHAYAMAHKYDEAIREHTTVVEILNKLEHAIECEVVKEAIRLQRDDHIRQLSLIKQKKKRAELTKAKEPSFQSVEHKLPECVFSPNQKDVYKTNKLIHQAVQAMCEQNSIISGITNTFKDVSISAVPTTTLSLDTVVKITKDEKAKFEELCVSNEELKKILFLLIAEVERIRSENKTLRNSLEELVFKNQKHVTSRVFMNLPVKDVHSKSNNDVICSELPVLPPVKVLNMAYKV